MKLIETPIGKLYHSDIPSELVLSNNFDCIFNAAKELNFMYDKPRPNIKKIIFGNIEDYSIPDNSKEFVDNIKYISELLRDNKTVLVHCFGGHGRTGLSICFILYLLTKNNKIDILKFVREQVKGPETKLQVEFFLNYNLDNII